MARYIDVEPLEDKLKEHIEKTESELMLGALSTFLRVLDITPTADVAPVRHGHWDVREPMPMHDIKGNLSWGNWYVCTGCGFATTAAVQSLKDEVEELKSENKKLEGALWKLKDAIERKTEKLDNYKRLYVESLKAREGMERELARLARLARLAEVGKK